MRVDRDLLSWMPDSIRQILERLNRAGFAAYVVGGCVRDALLGRRPHDWDICTSALPQEVVACFTDRIVHLTGVKHGTVLVSWEGEGVEITTFRTEGGYSDHRHPDRVTFVRSLETDLARLWRAARSEKGVHPLCGCAGAAVSRGWPAYFAGPALCGPVRVFY